MPAGEPMSIVDRETLLGLMQPRTLTLREGEVLVREGEVSGRMFLLEEGQLEVLRETEGGRTISIGVIAPGQLVGEVSLLQGTPHTATVRATTECQLLEVSRELLDRFDPERSTPLEYLLREMARSVSAHLRRISDGALEAMERELQLSRLRQSMASFLVVLLMGLAAYAVLMRILTDLQVDIRVTILFTLPILVVMAAMGIAWGRRSGFPAWIFGLTREGAASHVRQALVLTVPVLILLTGIKWGLCTWSPRYADVPVFSIATKPLALATLGPTLGYVALVPVQEFVARGAIQGPLFEFMVGTERRRWSVAILVSNTLFGVTHLHLTLAYGAAAFAGGLVWGALFARQRSLVGPIVSHAVVGLYALEVLGFASILKGVS